MSICLFILLEIIFIDCFSLVYHALIYIYQVTYVNLWSILEIIYRAFLLFIINFQPYSISKFILLGYYSVIIVICSSIPS